MLGGTAAFLATSSPHKSFYEENDDDVNSEHQNVSLSKYLWKAFVSNIYLFSIVSYALWTLLGILFYRYYNDFTWGTAYYYAMEAGTPRFTDNVFLLLFLSTLFLQQVYPWDFANPSKLMTGLGSLPFFMCSWAAQSCPVVLVPWLVS